MRVSKGDKKFFSVDRLVSCLGAEICGHSRDKAPLSQYFRVDSRTIEQGDVFVAMKGRNGDGHNYIDRAIERGASAVILESAHRDEWFSKAKDSGALMISVRDSQSAIACMAKRWLDEISPKVVGITGSVGKTTTREFLFGMLKGSVKTHAAVKSFNTLIGCSMTILAMPAGTEVLVLELGTNHPGEISELVESFPVSHGVITEIVSAHIEGLGSVEGVLRAKMEMLESDALQYLSYNNDNKRLAGAILEWTDGLPEKRIVKAVGVGVSPSQVTIREIRQHLASDGTPTLSFTLTVGEESYPCEANIFGKQHARNIAYAFALATELGISPKSARKSVSALASLSGRGKIYSLRRGSLLVDESYNANPGSLSCALKNILETDVPEGCRRVAVLGGMRELGEESACWHEVVLSRASLFDDIYLIGSEWNSIEMKMTALRGHWRETKDFMRDADLTKFENAIILLKGSRYYELEKFIPMLTGAR